MPPARRATRRTARRVGRRRDRREDRHEDDTDDTIDEQAPVSSDALSTKEILDQRLAKGEISIEEYNDLLKTMQ